MSERQRASMNTLLMQIKPTTPRQTINTVILVMSIIAAIVFPWVVDSALVGVGLVALIYAMRNFTWNIAGGLAGMLSLAHVAAYGIGAFAVAILTWGHGISVWIAIMIGMVLSGLVGIAISLIMSRFGVNAFFFALGTAALALAISGIAASWSVTGKVNGLQNNTSGEGFAQLQWFLDPKPLYYVALVMLMLIVVLTAWMTSRTRLGRSLPFIREDPDMASSMGIDVVRNQALAMGLSMALTAIPGSLIALYTSFVSYESVLTLEIGILMVVGAIIGGSSTLAGPIVAGIGIAALEEGLRSFDVTSSSVSSATQIIYAAVVILILRLGSDGIVPMWNALLDRLLPVRESADEDPLPESLERESEHA